MTSINNVRSGVLAKSLWSAACGAMALVAMPAAAQNFPYNVNYPAGLASQGIAPDQGKAVAEIRADWELWKSRWVTGSGAANDSRRVLYDNDGPEKSSNPQDTNLNTVSEGLGYGVLMAVYLDDQNLFDRFYTYVQIHEKSDGLMGYKIEQNGNFLTSVNGNRVYGDASAADADADEDIAVALVFADAKWSTGNTGKTYLADAKNMINAIMDNDVDSKPDYVSPGSQPSYVLLGGDTRTPISFNPSYFAPAWYRIFQSVTADNRWSQVIDASYALEQKCANKDTGLEPKNCGLDGNAFPGQDHNYAYNAFRTPIREAIDHSWNSGETRGSVQVNAGFWASHYDPNGIPADPYASSAPSCDNPKIYTVRT